MPQPDKMSSCSAGPPLIECRWRDNVIAALNSSVWSDSHRRTMSGRCGPKVYPLTSDAVGPVEEFSAWPSPVLDDHSDSGVEMPLGMTDVGYARAHCVDDILNRNLRSCGFENRPAISVGAAPRELAQNEEIGHLRGGDQSHQVEVKIRVTGGGHEHVAVT